MSDKPEIESHSIGPHVYAVYQIKKTVVCACFGGCILVNNNLYKYYLHVADGNLICSLFSYVCVSQNVTVFLI
jgi:hypothetical protein